MNVVGKNNKWRDWQPIQKGIQLTTAAVIALHKEKVQEGEQEYLLTNRCNTDTAENLFSQVRFIQKHPTPKQFKDALRQVTLSQYLHVRFYMHSTNPLATILQKHEKASTNYNSPRLYLTVTGPTVIKL